MLQQLYLIDKIINELLSSTSILVFCWLIDISVGFKFMPIPSIKFHGHFKMAYFAIRSSSTSSSSLISGLVKVCKS